MSNKTDDIITDEPRPVNAKLTLSLIGFHGSPHCDKRNPKTFLSSYIKQKENLIDSYKGYNKLETPKILTASLYLYLIKKHAFKVSVFLVDKGLVTSPE